MENDGMIQRSTSERVGGGLLAYADALRAGVIEAGVRPLTDALYAAGLVPISSCEGHITPHRWVLRGRIEHRPFVLFRGSTESARAIAQQLWYGQGLNDELHYVWTLSGYFYPPDMSDLVWVIAPDDARIPDEWDRRKADADFMSLARIVTSIVI
jgi:hypothetical protein